MVDRERSRSHLLVAALLIIGLTLPLPQHTPVHGLGMAVTLTSLVVLCVLSFLRPLMGLLNRVAGSLIALQVAGLVALTGGARSPYNVLYPMLLLYAAVFYSTRRTVPSRLTASGFS